MRKYRYIFLLVAVIFAISCNYSERKNNIQTGNQYLTQSVLWYGYSGEMKALYYQAYNFARLMLDINLKDANAKQKKAVIVDIDETVLNNVAYEAWLVSTDSQQSKTNWKQWIEKADADTLPGALDFLKYADSKGFAVFYVSNRSVSDVGATIKNLQKFGFPCADENHMLFKSGSISSKELRRKQISDEYDIILLCGDNLADFSDAFDNRDVNSINNNIAKFRNEFGKRFIVLPNPIYGAWEKQIYGNVKVTEKNRDSLIHMVLSTPFNY